MAETPSTPSPTRRRVTRSRDERVVGGVCGGLGEHLDVDPVLFRLAFVLLAFAGGSGVLAYLVAWIVLPEGPPATAAGPRRGRTGGPAVGVVAGAVLLAIGVLYLFDFTLPNPFFRIGWPAALIAGGIALVLWGRNERRERTGGTAGPEPTTRPAPTAGTGAAVDPTTELAATERRPPLPDAEAEPPRGRSGLSLTGLVLGAFLVLVGLGAVGDLLDWFDVTPAGVMALGVILFGGGAVAGAFLGGGRALIPLGIVAALLLMLFSWIDVPLHGGIGDRHRAPSELSELEREYHHGIGELTVDLRDVPLEGGTEAVELRLGIGHLVVVLPPDVDLELRARAGIGEVSAFGRSEDGTGAELELTDDVTGTDARFVIDAEVGLGQVEVTSGRPGVLGR